MNYIKFPLLLIMGFAVLHAQERDLECASHVFVPRSISTDLTYINALTYANRHLHVSSDKPFTYAGQIIYQQSKTSKALGAAFLNGASNQIVVQQTPLAPNAVDAIGLQLANTDPLNPFSSTFEISPQRKIFAYHGYFYANLDAFWCGLWFDAAFAIVNARHSLHCTETGNVSTMCPGIATVGQALSNSDLDFGKFFCGLCDDEKRRTGFDDLQLRLGYDYQWCGCNLFGIYLIGTVPSGRKPTAEFIFEPLVGSRHASFGVGFHGDYQFNSCVCPEASVVLMTDFNYRYVFSHRECRTFDLLPQGAFSRFLPVVTLANPFNTTAAVNILTQKVNVLPRSTIQWWLGLNYEYCDMNFEVGYNLWWRQKEKLKDDTALVVPADVSLFDLSGAGIFAPLTVDNIDLVSGLAGRALTNKVYGAFSWNGCICDGCFDWMTGFGGSYEFVVKHDRCSALSNWAVFGKVAVSF